MKKKIIVTIKYNEFEFDNIDDAVIFAETAKRTATEDMDVEVNIAFKNEKEKE